MTPEQMTELAARLRDFGKAYPVEIFPEITNAERAEHGRLITRAAAQMGRHFAKFAVPAADLIAGMAQRVPLNAEQIADCATKIKPYPIELVQVPAEQLIAFIRAIEQAHGIRSEK